MVEKEKMKNDEGKIEKNFLPIEDLVYASVNAVAYSDRKLRESIIQDIKSRGKVKKESGKEVVHLTDVNLQYRKTSEEDGTYGVEEIRMSVPAMSVIPVNNLKVDEASIEFTTELVMTDSETGEKKINGRICSPDLRESDFLPKATFSLKLKSYPVAEGLQRILDELDNGRIAEQKNFSPVDSSGVILGDEEKDKYRQIKEMKRYRKKLMTAEVELINMIEVDPDRLIMGMNKSELLERISEEIKKCNSRLTEFYIESAELKQLTK